MVGARLIGTATGLVVAGALLAVAPVAGPARDAPAAVASAAAAPSCGGQRPAKPGGGRYQCTFEENFNGSSLNRDVWLPQVTWLSGMTTGGKDCYVDRPANITVTGGTVRLRSHVEEKPFVCHSPYGDFTATRTVAAITTWDTFNQAYGRFEFRARFDHHRGPGFVSALWLYPRHHTYGRWPHSGEIDVAEWLSGHPDKVYPSVHYAGESGSTGMDCAVANAGRTFHRYAVEWTPTEMRFLYDGRVCFTHAWSPSAPLAAPKPFDHPFYIVLSQTFGTTWNTPDANTPSTGETVVDWVRAWR